MYSCDSYQTFVPWAFGFSCFIETSTDNADAISFLLRQYNVIAAAWFLYVAKAKTTISNLRAFFAVMLLTGVFGSFRDGQGIIKGPCGETWFFQWYNWLGIPFLVLLCAYVERFVERRSSTASETQALLV